MIKFKILSYSTDLNQKYELDNHEEEFNELTKIFFD